VFSVSSDKRGEAHSFHQAPGVGCSHTCNVVGGPVIDRGADDRQPEADVHSFVEMSELHRYKPLVVVHSYNRVKFIVDGAVENGIRRPWTADPGVKAGFVPSRFLDLGLELLDYGPDNLDFLAPELSGFSRMWIEARNCNAGRSHSEIPPHGLHCNADNFVQQ